MPEAQSGTQSILKQKSEDILNDWKKDLAADLLSDHRISESELTGQMREFLGLIQNASAKAGIAAVEDSAWTAVLEFLEGVSRSRAIQGFSSDQTANFIFSFKKPLFEHLRNEMSQNPKGLASEIWAATELIDRLGLHTVKTFQKAREEVIGRQQQDLLELSTPVVKLWDGILALPMIGTLDSERTQVVMETLLQKIVDTGSQIAIIDITGVPTVDTMTAQHLLKTVTAIRMMGADCIISGIRPQIAQTIVHLGIDLQGIMTKANLADALALALSRSGFTVSKKQ